LISCFSGHLRWGLIAIRHQPERVMRQFEFVQSIPPEAIDSWVSFEEIDDRWMHYLDHLAPASQICVVPGQCAPKYMDWFLLISHPFMTVAQTSDPPRHPPVTQDASFVEPHIPQVLVAPTAAPAHAPSDVEQPRHAMVRITIWFVVSNFIYLSYCNTNLVVFYLIGCLPCDH